MNSSQEKTELTDNELIDAFYVQQGGKATLKQDLSFYESDWNMLMPVVDKIEGLYHRAFPPGEKFIEMILAKEDPIDNHYIDVIALPLGTPINEAYEAIVKFIEWHNEGISQTQHS